MADNAGKSAFERRYTLAEAAQVFFPGRQITKKSLLTEIRKGRLRAESIAAKYVVTERAIQAMCEACALTPKKDKDVTCRSERSRPASTFGEPAPETQLSGSSGTE